MNKYKRLLSNTAILAVGTFSSKVLVYLLLPLYTAILSPAEYSDANLISQLANLLMPIAAVGICDGLFRFALDAGEKKREVFSSGITVLLCGTLVFLLLSPLLFAVDMLTGYVWLAVIYVIAANFQSACANYLRALGKTTVFAVQGIINTALNIGFNILFLVVFDMGVTGYVLSVVVANLMVTALMVVWQKLYRDVRLSLFDRAIARDILKYSIPMIPTTIFWWMTSVSGQFLVKHICGDEANGIFAASYKIPTVLTLMTTIFIEAWQYSAVADADEHDRGSFFSEVFRTYSGLHGGVGAYCACKDICKGHAGGGLLHRVAVYAHAGNSHDLLGYHNLPWQHIYGQKEKRDVIPDLNVRRGDKRDALPFAYSENGSAGRGCGGGGQLFCGIPYPRREHSEVCEIQYASAHTCA